MADQSTDKPGLRIPILQGLLPLDRTGIPTDIIAGVTLAALAIPEVMGYTSIAGMPVITGLYTILIPLLLFALLGSSRHLVVGADSATAAVLAAGLAGLATAQSSDYVALAGMVALMAAVLLIIARLVGLGFLADFMSRTVLVGFLTGVGIQVAFGQIGGMLGIPSGSGVTIDGRTFDNTIGKLWSTLENIGDVSWSTVAVSAGVIIVILGGKAISPKIPGALIAVLGAMFISWQMDLADDGVATLGKVPSGLPSLDFPSVPWSDVPALAGTAASIFVLILAQSAATSRAYAAKYSDKFDENVDLVGLGAANLGAAFTGTFVVNGSPTKTQMVDGAGGKSQFASVVTVAIVAIVLLWLTAPLQYMPEAVLSTVVFLIGIELVDLLGMKRIWRLRRDEFVVAAITAGTVVLVGVLQGIIVAIVLSIIDHLRRSYRPPTAVLTSLTGEGAGDWAAADVTPDARTEPGLVVYRFSAPLYYANAEHLSEELLAFGTSDDRPEWVCLYAAAVPDIDLSGADSLRSVYTNLQEQGVRLVLIEVMPEVREELDRYGLTEEIGAEYIFPTIAAAEHAFRARAQAQA
ncbi:MAG TPA: SulP family inorganic anion transporter [Ilumatobacteraceae bacterium]|nr:SulP family inorganic anion transporter [Ilumatobacteraceae bacterium]